jgi:hypothetical protein
MSLSKRCGGVDKVLRRGIDLVQRGYRCLRDFAVQFDLERKKLEGDRGDSYGPVNKEKKT